MSPNIFDKFNSLSELNISLSIGASLPDKCQHASTKGGGADHRGQQQQPAAEEPF
jgi:hypothetical protein